jgi:hypothetical protein
MNHSSQSASVSTGAAFDPSAPDVRRDDRRHGRLAEARPLDAREDDPLAVGRPARLDGARADGTEARDLCAL